MGLLLIVVLEPGHLSNVHFPVVYLHCDKLLHNLVARTSS